MLIQCNFRLSLKTSAAQKTQDVIPKHNLPHSLFGNKTYHWDNNSRSLDVQFSLGILGMLEDSIWKRRDMDCMERKCKETASFVYYINFPLKLHLLDNIQIYTLLKWSMSKIHKTSVKCYKGLTQRDAVNI